MKNIVILSSLFSLLLFTGCQKPDVVDVITIQPSDYDVMLFSDGSNQSLKHIYMDALLELKAAYPDEFYGGKEEEKKVDELEHTVDVDSPTLLILKNGQTVARVTGKKSKTEIIKQLTRAIQ